MKTYNSIAPRMYGNPKVHKSGYPMRPIISSINSPLNALSKFIADILKNAYDENNEYYVRDTYYFASSMNNFKLPEGYSLISLDVVNFFGNLDKNNILKVLEQNWNRKIKKHTKLEKELFLEITLFLLENNYCIFRGEYYIQKFGCAMGSKLSPILAQYVMDDLVTYCVQKLPFEVPFLKKFVDDIITSVPEGETETILNTFNSYSQNLQFTLEVEDFARSVPFLDTRVHRHEEGIRLQWYRKETNSDKLIHYNSNHNIKMKINIVKQIKQRIIRICHDSYQQEGINRLSKILKQNGYPNGLLNKLLYATHTTNTQPQRDESKTGDTKYASYPNINGLTPKLRNIFQGENVKIAVYNQKTVGNLYTKLKDPIPNPQKSNVVYEIECENCERKYIGQTSQWLKSRLTLHKSDIRKHHERCALATHAVNTGHSFNFEDTKVLTIEKNYYKRIVLEMIEINKRTNTINKKTDTNKLSIIYKYLLEHNQRNLVFFDGPVDG